MSQLNHLVGLTEKAAKQDPSVFAKSISTDTLPLPRVPSKNVDQAQRHVTRSMTDQTQSVPRVSVSPRLSMLPSDNPPVVRSAVRKKKKKKKKKAPPVSVDASAQNTQSRVQEMSNRLAPPAASTQARTGTSTRSSRLRQASTAQTAKARAGSAAAVEVRLS